MYRVLIAEDSKPILRNIKGLIEGSGLPVAVAATAAHGEEALAVLERQEIDILLTDIRMPKMDGLALIERAKRIRPQLKAVLISGYNDFEYTRKAINLQVSDYLMKPVERAQLVEVLDKVMAQLRESEDDAASDFEEIDRIAAPFVSMIEQLSKEPFLLMLSEQLVKWEQDGIRLAEIRRFVRILAQAFAPLTEDGETDAEWLQDSAERLQVSPERFRSELLDWAEQIFLRAKSLNRKSGEELFGQIDRYLGTNLYANVSIPDLVHRFHVSSSYISRIVKRYTGQTFVHYYTDMKLKEACRLMETKPEMKVWEISDALCFADPHYFSKVFKERIGCRPVEYKAARGEK